jgi:hypothetical protein
LAALVKLSVTDLTAVTELLFYRWKNTFNQRQVCIYKEVEAYMQVRKSVRMFSAIHYTKQRLTEAVLQLYSHAYTRLFCEQEN